MLALPPHTDGSLAPAMHPRCTRVAATTLRVAPLRAPAGEKRTRATLAAGLTALAPAHECTAPAASPTNIGPVRGALRRSRCRVLWLDQIASRARFNTVAAFLISIACFLASAIRLTRVGLPFVLFLKIPLLLLVLLLLMKVRCCSVHVLWNKAQTKLHAAVRTLIATRFPLRQLLALSALVIYQPICRIR